jgi:hypothetical protein
LQDVEDVELTSILTSLSLKVGIDGSVACVTFLMRYLNNSIGTQKRINLLIDGRDTN